MSASQHNGYNAPRRYTGCNDAEDRLKRAVDFLAETRRQVVATENDKFWMDRYHEADNATREACMAFLATPVPLRK